MNEGIITTVQTRGQITLPLKLRMKHGIGPGSAVVVKDRDNEITVTKLENEANLFEGPVMGKKEYVQKVKQMGGGHWTKADDRHLRALKGKEKTWQIWAK